MDKFCIFCGGEPVAKNKEHVLPQWLIELTGNPKRLAGFGIDLFSSKQRKYSLNQFQFPACKDCNNEFSSLEGKAKTFAF